MPFKSKAQQRYAYATKQPWAEEFTAATKKKKKGFKDLPDKVDKRVAEKIFNSKIGRGYRQGRIQGSLKGARNKKNRKFVMVGLKDQAKAIFTPRSKAKQSLTRGQKIAEHVGFNEIRYKRGATAAVGTGAAAGAYHKGKENVKKSAFGVEH